MKIIFDYGNTRKQRFSEAALSQFLLKKTNTEKIPYFGFMIKKK